MCTWYSEIFLVLKITEDNLATIVVRSLAIITKKTMAGLEVYTRSKHPHSVIFMRKIEF